MISGSFPGKNGVFSGKKWVMGKQAIFEEKLTLLTGKMREIGIYLGDRGTFVYIFRL